MEILAAEKISRSLLALSLNALVYSGREQLALNFLVPSFCTYSDFAGTFLPHPVSCLVTQQDAINPLPAPLMPARKVLLLLVGVAQSWLPVVFNRNRSLCCLLNGSECYRINYLQTASPVTLSENHLQQCSICICIDWRFSCSASTIVSRTCMYAPNEL